MDQLPFSFHHDVIGAVLKSRPPMRSSYFAWCRRISDNSAGTNFSVTPHRPIKHIQPVTGPRFERAVLTADGTLPPSHRVHRAPHQPRPDRRMPGDRHENLGHRRTKGSRAINFVHSMQVVKRAGSL
jgi:hypothetical protein